MKNDLSGLVSVDKGGFIYVGKLKYKDDNEISLDNVLTFSSKIILETTKDAEWNYRRRIRHLYEHAPSDFLESNSSIKISKKTTIHYLD